MLDFPEGSVHVADSSFTIERLSLQPKRDTAERRTDGRRTESDASLSRSRAHYARCPSLFE